MKTQIRPLLAIGVATLSAMAQAAAPAAAPISPPSSSPAGDSPQAPAPQKQSAASAELEGLVARIKTKIQAGNPTEESLSLELKEFDALVAAHKGEKTEDAAQIPLLQALLYAQVLHNFDKAEVLLRQLKSDFPDTEAGKNVDKILPELQKQKDAQKAQSNLKAGAVFPDFQEKDLAGQPLSLAQFKGKVVLVDFWATWCGPCVAELPNVLAAYQKYHDKGFEIVGISLDKDKAELEKFTKEKGMTWAQYFDGKGWESELGRRYGVTSIPATYLLDGDGKIIALNLRGPALEAELANRLAAK